MASSISTPASPICQLGVGAHPALRRQWWGDSAVDDFRLTGVYCEPMSTAVVRIFTPEGFVIAADGLRKYADGRVLSENVQKVFPTQSRLWGHLAFALTGWTWVENDSVKMDWASHAKSVAASLESKPIRDTEQYGELLSGKIRGWVSDNKSKFREYYNQLIPQDTKLLLCGYVDGGPRLSTHRLTFGQKIRHECTEKFSPHQSAAWFSGSPVIKQILLDGTDRNFDRYKTTGLEKLGQEEISLVEAIDVAKNYILACSDPKAREIDKNCEQIGGHIHIATITPQTGFKWHTPPKS